MNNNPDCHPEKPESGQQCFNLNRLLNKIHLADCMDVLRALPDKCIDLVLTDPPYGKGGDKQTEGRFGNKGSRFEKYRPVARTGDTWAEKGEKKNCSVGRNSNARGF